MSGFLDGIGKVFGKISDQFQTRVERLKNEQGKLLAEKRDLERKDCDEKISLRISAIDTRVDELDELLKNAAKD